MSAIDVIVRRIDRPDDEAMAGVLRIFVDAIPAAERKPVEWLRDITVRTEPGCSAAGSSASPYQLLVAERPRAVLGFAVLFIPSKPDDAALLEYLAVAGPARGTGIGGVLFRACRVARPGPMIVEIDTADPDADRRRRFYQRLGCRAVMGLQYKLPVPNAGPMGLMVAGTDIVRREDLRRWITTIYAEVYGQRPGDPRIAGMVGGLAEQLFFNGTLQS